MSPALTPFGHVSVPAYELLLALGACVLVTVVAERVARVGLPAGPVFLWLAGTYVSAVVGARMAFAASWLPSTRDALAALASPAVAGFSSIGALVAGGAVAWALARRLRLPFERLLSPLVLGGCCFGALARVGCFLAGCCHGGPTTMPWGAVYPNGSAAARTFGTDVPVHPSPLYEAALLLTIAGVLAWRQRRRARTAHGERILALESALAVVVYLAGRFALDFARGDVVRHAGLATTQWLALALLIGGAAFAFRESFAAEARPPVPRGIVD